MIRLQQSNYVPSAALGSLASGADGAQIAAAAGTGIQTGFLRSPVNLTFADTELDPPVAAPHAAPGFTMSAGSSIVGDPGASITINADHVADIEGTIIAPGGSITVTDSGSPTQVTLGAASRLDVAGIALFDPRQVFTTGTVLAGGT